MTQTVDVLLATYNGARFLPELLASIERQTHRDWRLIVRDDGSTDGSPEVIEAFARRHRERVQILRDPQRLGACGNFATLLQASDAPYFMFCDQDDVWLPQKITTLLHLLRQVEERRGGDTPILVHSDLVVIDEDLRVLHRSFWRYSRLLHPSAKKSPARLLVRNYVTGCACLGNAALRRAALPIPADAYMHDFWVALVAAFLGEIAEHEGATILYRQHLSNEVGAQPRKFLDVLVRFLRGPAVEMQNVRIHLEKCRKQAMALERSCKHALTSKADKMLLDLIHLRGDTFLNRKSFLFRYRLWPDYWLSSIILFLFL